MFPFRLTDCPFLFHFFFPFVKHMFDFSARSISLFSPFIFCWEGHFVHLDSRRRIRLSQLLRRTLAMVFREYAKRRILFHQAKGYHAPTIADKPRDKGIVVSRKGVSDFLSRVEKTCSTTRCFCTSKSLPFCCTCC